MQELRILWRRYGTWDSRVQAVPAAVAWLFVGGLVLIGILIRIRYLDGRSINSDEAVAGIMATRMLHGHFVAFYWGQSYGGSLETLLIAGAFAVFGPAPTTLVAVPIVLAGVAGVLTWRIAARLVESSWLAAFAGAVAWVAPQAAVSNSAYEWGFRGVTMVCGLLAILTAIRLRDSHRPLADAVVLGLALGAGWWSSPEVVYFALPAVLIAVMSLRNRWQEETWRKVAANTGAVVGGAVVGALPWIWANVGSHLRSLSQRYFGLPKHAPGYFGHLRIFGEYSLGILFSLRTQSGWIGGRALGVALLGIILVVLVGAIALCVRRGGPAAVLGVAVVAFPFLLATSPSAWYWSDGRYVGYVVPLIVLVLVAGWSNFGPQLSGRAGKHSASPWGWKAVGDARLGSAAVLAVGGLMITTSLYGYHTYHDGKPLQHGVPNGAVTASVHTLEAQSIRYGYAGYWVAYYVDFLSGERLTIVPVPHDRNRAMTRAVQTAPTAAWLFVAPPNFGYFLDAEDSIGPNHIPEQRFRAYLSARHIPYQVIDAGPLQAVVPDRNVSPRSV